MDSNATTVLLLGFGPGCTVYTFITSGLATSGIEPVTGVAAPPIIGLAICLGL